MALNIVNPRPEYDRVALADPPPTGYIHLAAVVEATRGRTPFPRGSARKSAVLSRLKDLARDLERRDDVGRATVYRAVLVPPLGPDGRVRVDHPARYDVAVLIETASIDVLDDVTASPEYERLRTTLGDAARDMNVMTARCLRRIADVDKSRQGLFLFNYFVAENPDVAVALWEHLAGWYTAETGLDNSTLLAPIGAADYVFVNHARWDRSLPRFMVDQFSKKTFRSYVLANLRANATVSMPILYRLA